MNELVELKDLNTLDELCQLYKSQLPKYYIAYNTLRNYVRWLKENWELPYVNIYSLNGNWRENGLYLILDRYNLMLHSLKANDPDLSTAMQLLHWQRGYKITAITSDEVEVMKSAVAELKIELRLYTLHTYTLSRSRALELSVDCPAGYELGKLDVRDLQYVHDNWPPRQKASIHLLKRLIELNTTIALYKRDTRELIGWCISCHCGFLGSLHVDEAYRRQGLAALIVKAYARHMALVENSDTYVTVFHLNTVSQSLFEKLGFVRGDLDAYHIRAYRVSDEELWPFED